MCHLEIRAFQLEHQRLHDGLAETNLEAVFPVKVDREL